MCFDSFSPESILCFISAACHKAPPGPASFVPSPPSAQALEKERLVSDCGCSHSARLLPNGEMLCIHWYIRNVRVSEWALNNTRPFTVTPKLRITGSLPSSFRVASNSPQILKRPRRGDMSFDPSFAFPVWDLWRKPSKRILNGWIKPHCRLSAGTCNPCLHSTAQHLESLFQLSLWA